MKYRRILAIIEYLWKYSSKQHPKSIEDILQYLEMHQIEGGLKAVRNDLKFLTSEESFIKVETSQSGRNQFIHYWIKDRFFEIHELRYMMDAISSARFISEQETEKIIGKLKKFVSENEAILLENQLVHTFAKIDSPLFAKTVQTIHQAIAEKKVIQFQYGRYSVEKEFVLSGSPDPKQYLIHPYGIIWNEEMYYLIGYNVMEEDIHHYRIDRIRDIRMLEQKFAVQPGFDINKYRNLLFFMFGGEESSIEVIFKNDLAPAVIDRFGLHADIKRVDDEHFRLITSAIISKGLVRWLLSWGADAKVVYPKRLVEEMEQEAERLYEQYIGERA
ncbi:Predicted DNA-binding transcriptional regulator YafY, contains an HTH and WYL domains [Anoxybacillus pushchinoensis]|uniref:Predicted DNA-binding transcriptional regulator YafY, contains an HTH and WYL domains n=1 Tax=Anoxybacillus pushchinoensis TaxID=150248 RepID=A0A1I0TZ03_9BACL|nr:Predicted DNA-binding transcriptional regulator YafY, contains an HTH and WYL domains [Anoxybacillus pushchinoensis]